MLLDHLCQIGFTDNEAAIYLELLRFGSQAVSTVAARTGLNRTTAYSALKALAIKGVVSSHRSDGVRVYSASDPNSLIGFVDRKCQTFDYYRSQLLSLIPKFRSISGAHAHKKPVVNYFEGIEGVKHVLYDALDAKEFRGYLCMHKWVASGMSDFLVEYKNFRIFNKKMPLKAIVFDTPEVRAFFDKNYNKSCDMTKVLYVGHEKFARMFEHEFNIYNGKVAILCLDKGAEYGVIIESEEIFEMQKMIFEMAWKGFEGLE